MQFFRECINLDICVNERWWTWITKIHEKNLEDNWLWNYRKRIYDRAKMFGCNEVIICSDQGPTWLICEYLDKSADELVAYTKARRYIDESMWDDEKEKEEWITHGKLILFSEYFLGLRQNSYHLKKILLRLYSMTSKTLKALMAPMKNEDKK